MPNIEFKQGKIHFSDSGKGSAVIWLHGFLESQNMWGELIAGLPKNFRNICIDLPGHGASDCFGYTHSMELMAEAVNAVLKHLKLRKVIVVGHSMGGYVALALGESNPDVIGKMVLLHSTAKEDTEAKKAQREQALKLVRENHKSFVRHSIPFLFRPKNKSIFKNEIQVLKQEALQMSDLGIAAAIRGMKLRISREVILKFSPYPILIIAGKYDKVIPLEDAIELSKLNEHIDLAIISGAAHMGQIEAKDEIQKVLKNFFFRI